MRVIWGVVLMCGAAMAAGPARSPARLLGRPLYWMLDGVEVDTVGWRDIERTALEIDTTDRTSPEEAVDAFAGKGKAIFELRELSAISAAIVLDLGYSVFMLSQWRSEPSGYISFPGSSGEQGEFRKRRLAGDYLWEMVERADVGRAGRLSDGLRVEVHITGGGFCGYDDKDDMCKTASVIYSAGGSAQLHFIDNTDFELTVRRRIYRVYLVADAKSDPDALVSAIESTVDKLKLDMSYKAPVIERVGAE